MSTKLTDAQYRAGVLNVIAMALEAGVVCPEADARRLVNELLLLGVTPEDTVRSASGRLWLRGFFEPLN
jgi:hypothetical protein